MASIIKNLSKDGIRFLASEGHQPTKIYKKIKTVFRQQREFTKDLLRLGPARVVVSDENVRQLENCLQQIASSKLESILKSQRGHY